MLRLDLHTHSKYSVDSSEEVEDILETASRRGLHGICISDHNSLMGSEAASGLGSDHGLVIIRGMEISSAEGHILAYGLAEEVPRGSSATETVDRITDLGGFAVAAHPHRFWSGLGDEVTRKAGFHAIEGLNARSVASHNRRAEALAEELQIPVTAGSDGHRLADIGKAIVLLPDGLETEEDFLEALRKGQGRTAGVSRSTRRTLRYVGGSVGNWILRGFRKI